MRKRRGSAEHVVQSARVMADTGTRGTQAWHKVMHEGSRTHSKAASRDCVLVVADVVARDDQGLNQGGCKESSQHQRRANTVDTLSKCGYRCAKERACVGFNAPATAPSSCAMM